MVANRIINLVLSVAITLATIPIVNDFIDQANLTGTEALVAALVPLVMVFGVVSLATGGLLKKFGK